MVLTAYIVRAPARPAFVSPSPAHHRSTSLAPATRAPGPHAFAVRITRLRQRLRRAEHRTSDDALRPSHPASRFVTTARTPLVSRRDVVTIIIILRKTEEEYFSRDGLTGFQGDCTTGKSIALKMHDRRPSSPPPEMLSRSPIGCTPSRAPPINPTIDALYKAAPSFRTDKAGG
jgi:hypothetical protein